MSLTLSNRLITLWSAALLIAVPAAGATATARATGHERAAAVPASRAGVRPVVSHAAAVTVRQQVAAVRHWTPARMRAAIRGAWGDGDSLGSGLRWVHGGAIMRTTGKVFFTLNGTDYVCSGTAVDSAGRDVVLTAAHCTGNGPGEWAANWTFVPGYAGGARPYGAYTARRFYVSPRWADEPGTSSARAEKYDVAFVTVNPSGPRAETAGRGTVARRLGQVTGGQRVAFDRGAMEGQDTYVFGYPSDPPFSGLYPNYCAGLASQTPGDAADGAVSLSCGMTAGDSGGPWFAGFSPGSGTGTIVAVSTYKYTDGADSLYGTVLGADARSLYEAANSDEGGAPGPAGPAPRGGQARPAGGAQGAVQARPPGFPPAQTG